MNTTTLERQTAEDKQKQSVLPRHDFLEALALAVEGGGKVLGGIEGIEDYSYDQVDQLPISGTVFATIADEMANLGVNTDRTVGGVMEGLGYARGTKQASNVAHLIGCHCLGVKISAAKAASRIRTLQKL